MGFVTKEKLFSKDFFITYSWLIGGCFVFALGAVMFAEPYGFAPGGTYGLSMDFPSICSVGEQKQRLYVWMCPCCCSVSIS